MVKTITIADDVYAELVKIKGNRSFSEVIRDLLRKRRENSEALLRIFNVLSDDEAVEAKRKIEDVKRSFDRWRSSIRT